ncbi:MAG: hypothetical protein A2005_12560 [Desulfuromonadales bacterium GWC2_61_20]|nr:MAG: hypothetical protein A2005_12560 [Desulfuromonadales bacterium GWC2_61_20]
MIMTTRQCPGCGSRAMQHRTDQIETIRHGGDSVTVSGLSGWFCTACGEALLDEDSSRRYGEAGDALVERSRAAIKREIRRIRMKLGLTQKQAAEIFGGGVNAFSRYERGEVEPGPSTVKLLHLLDKHPELLREVVNE